MAKVVQELSDEELLQQCSMDDLRAYNELVERYAPRLHILGRKYLKDTFAVEELAMDLLFHLWEKRHTLSIEGNVSAYIFRSFRNRTIRYLRKSLPAMLEIEQIEKSVEPLAHDADYNLIYKEAEEDYKYKLSKLSLQRQRVFELSREENLSYADIAKKMNLSVNTVENYMVAALASLREQYKDAPAVLILVGLSIVAIYY